MTIVRFITDPEVVIDPTIPILELAAISRRHPQETGGDAAATGPCGGVARGNAHDLAAERGTMTERPIGRRMPPKRPARGPSRRV